MLMEYIASGIAGLFIGIILTGTAFKDSYDEIISLKKEISRLNRVLNDSKALKKLSVGQTVYGLTTGNKGFYKGEITEIYWTEKSYEVKLNNFIKFDYKNIFLDKEEVLKHIK